ncbi:MAG: chorismate-binding protein [Bacteroidota bacterium]
MTVIKDIHSLTKLTPAQLWALAEDKKFPMAAWNPPGSTKNYLLIGLSDLTQVSTQQIEELGEGFVVNAFDHSHPPQPLFMKADLLMTWGDAPAHLSVAPSLSSSEIDEFIAHINSKETVPMPPMTNVEAYRFQETVKRCLPQIDGHDLLKVVLSRCDDHSLPEGFDAFGKFQQLVARYPEAMNYLLYLPGRSKWLGATPEQLLKTTEGRHFQTASLAGTQLLKGNERLKDVAWTQKEIEEQAIVSRYIIDCFKKIRLREFEEHGPRTVRAGKLAHLKTQFVVDMDSAQMPKLGSIMLDLLHPTSAVCGTPMDVALDFIRTHEHYDRELYSGFLGPIHIDQEVNLFVNLRCMQIRGNKGRFYAGAGITEDSDPQKEEIETELKLQTMKSVVFDT